jgi:N-acetyl-anhydromuramyl-L-alanine amidase AmpD
MLHYTVSQDLESVKATYYDAGVSSHFTIEHEGDIYCHVDTLNIAFHAGISQFRGMSSLNRYFIGMEHINPGYVEPGKIYPPKFGTAHQVEGDSRSWFRFSEQQFVSSACLTRDLQVKHRIKASLVLTHADAAVGRKFDIGPMYDHRRAFFDYGAGYYPEYREIDLFKFRELIDDDYITLIRLYGYRSPDLNATNEIKAFQMHFSPTDISGLLSDTTKKSILNLSIDYSGCNDKYYSVDREYNEGLYTFIQDNPDRTTGFREFIAD